MIGSNQQQGVFIQQHIYQTAQKMMIAPSMMKRVD